MDVTSVMMVSTSMIESVIPVICYVPLATPLINVHHAPQTLFSSTTHVTNATQYQIA